MTKLLERAMLGWIFLAVAYQAVSSIYTLNGAMEHYTAHLVLILGIVTLEGATICSQWKELRFRKLRQGGFIAMFLLTVACGSYLYVRAEPLQFQQPFLRPGDFAAGLTLLAVIFVLTWAVWGWLLSTLCLVAAVYLGFGYLLPAAISSVKLAPDVVVSYLAGMGGPRGVFTYMPLSADTVFLLIVFGGLLSGADVITMFTELGKALGNLLRGGVAFSSVIASSLIGMVTGQAVGNIALAGSVTIPTMIRSGFTREQAGAIECLASNGSQLIPPVMGLGAFLMAANLNVPYVKIAIAGIIPGILYEATVAIGLYAMIAASPRIPYRRENVDWGRIGWTLPSFVPSFGILLCLLYFGYSPALAALWGILSLAVLTFVRPKAYRPNISALVKGIRDGALAAAKLALILAAIGVMVQMLTTTGVGVLMGQWMIKGSAHSAAIGYILGAIISLLIGMGLPTPAAYSLIAIVVVPSLITLGLTPLVANFYGFYFAIFSSLTPPVAVAIFTAMRISRGTFRGTVWDAFKLAGVCLLLPVIFVQFPSVLDLSNGTLEMLFAVILYILATYMAATSIYGVMRVRLGIGWRVLLLAGPASFIAYFVTKSVWWGLPAIAAFLIVLTYSRLHADLSLGRELY